MKTFKLALIKTLPIMFSYVFLGTAFGIMMQEAGYGYIWSALASVFIYTGAFQMALAGFIKAQASMFSILVTAFALGSRHIFYGISFIDDFKKMKSRYPYMIFSLTDETYALYCGTEVDEKTDLGTFRFISAILCQSYWILGSILGGILGSVIPFDFKGIDFTMTAMFVTVFVDQWRGSKDHKPAIIGVLVSVICLLAFGKSNFILPALVISTIILLLVSRKEATQHD